MLFFSLVLTLVIGFALHKTIGFRVTEEEEQAGVDGSEHAETGYDLGSFGAGARGVSYGGPAPRQTEVDTNHDQEVITA